MYKLALPEQLPREEKQRRRLAGMSSCDDEVGAEPDSGDGLNPGEGSSDGQRLKAQVRELQKRLALESERHLCKICYEREINTVMLHCNHRAVCSRCLDQVTQCPLCRAPITRIIQTYNA